MQAALRSCLALWGLPARLKVDNGSPWGTRADLPPPLALWLVGLGIDVHWSRPRVPQDNGVVERSHGTALRWASPATCGDVAELPARLDREDRVQREEYPHLPGRPRMQAYPGLAHSARPYDPGREAEAWSWRRVLDHVGRYAVARRVDCSGKVGLYQGKRYVGAALKGRRVLVQFDPDAEQWLVADGRGAELCRRPLTQFTAELLRQLPDQPPQPDQRFRSRGKNR